jgi:hypothetical protein
LVATAFSFVRQGLGAANRKANQWPFLSQQTAFPFWALKKELLAREKRSGQ